MKTKMTILALGLLLAAEAIAGKKQLFQDAISHGNRQTGFYCIDNRDGDRVSMADMRQYVAQQNYLAAEGESDDRGRVKRLYFIAPADYQCYVHYKLSPEGKDLRQLKSKGLACLYEPYVDWLGSVSSYAVRSHREALWTGNLKDGFIHGKGSGLIKDSQEKYIYFEGEFDRGCPVAETTFKYYKNKWVRHSDVTFPTHGIKAYKADIPTPDLYLKEVKWKETDDVTRSCLLRRLETIYTQSVPMLEAERKRSLTVNAKNYQTFRQLKDVELFHQTYSALNYDPQQLLPKAEELIEFYDIVKDLRISPDYIYRNSWNYKDLSLEEKKQLVDEGIAKAKAWQKKSRCGLGQFYTMAIAELTKKSAEISRRKQAEDEYRRKAKAQQAQETQKANAMQWVRPDRETPWEQETTIFGNPDKGHYTRSVFWNAQHMNGEWRSITITKIETGSIVAYNFGSGVSYGNYDDVLAAAYVYLKTGYVRTIGAE